MRTLRLADRRCVGAAIIVLCCAYLAYPYVTLYRLGQAMQRGDVSAVMASVDWDSVRSGIATDLASAMTGAQAQAQPDALPAFGASFASTVATTAVDRALTPTALAASFETSPGARAVDPPAAHLLFACFTSPTRFVAALRTSDGARVRLQLSLVGTRWKLTRAWLPPEMLLPRRT